MMSPGVRKLALVAHVGSSVAWLWAVLAFLAVAIVALKSGEAQRVQAASLMIQPVAAWVIVPLCLASLVTGIVQGIGTSWGLLQHWWVGLKLGLTCGATVLLMVHLQPIEDVARAAEAGRIVDDDLTQLRTQLVFDAAAAVFVLLMTTTLSVVKPQGLTLWGLRQATKPAPST